VPNVFLRPTEASVQKIVDRVREAAPLEIQAIRNSEFGIWNLAFVRYLEPPENPRDPERIPNSEFQIPN
jgi:hypothetical protein